MHRSIMEECTTMWQSICQIYTQGNFIAGLQEFIHWNMSSYLRFKKNASVHHLVRDTTLLTKSSYGSLNMDTIHHSDKTGKRSKLTGKMGRNVYIIDLAHRSWLNRLAWGQWPHDHHLPHCQYGPSRRSPLCNRFDPRGQWRSLKLWPCMVPLWQVTILLCNSQSFHFDSCGHSTMKAF